MNSLIISFVVLTFDNIGRVARFFQLWTVNVIHTCFFFCFSPATELTIRFQSFLNRKKMGRDMENLLWMTHVLVTLFYLLEIVMALLWDC